MNLRLSTELRVKMTDETVCRAAPTKNSQDGYNGQDIGLLGVQVGWVRLT